MIDIEFKIQEKCREEGTKVKLKNDHNSYVYMGIAYEKDMSIKRVLKESNKKETFLKIVDNEYYIENAYLDFTCLENLKDLIKELEDDFGFSKNPEEFFKTYSLFKDNYSKIKHNEEKIAFNEVYNQYEKGFKKNILSLIKDEFPEQNQEVEFIASLTLDIVFQQFIFKIYMDDMEKNNE